MSSDVATLTATRVELGETYSGGVTVKRNPSRATMGRLVNADALVLAQGLGVDGTETGVTRRLSGSSVLTAGSSILESFPFVPPSPISDRPLRTPPVSPLQKQAFAAEGAKGHTQQPLSPPSASAYSQVTTAIRFTGSDEVPPLPTHPLQVPE